MSVFHHANNTCHILMNLRQTPFFFRNYDKLRVILLYANFKGGLSKEERQIFVDRLGLTEGDREVLEGLQVLGFRPEVGFSHKLLYDLMSQC